MRRFGGLLGVVLMMGLLGCSSAPRTPPLTPDLVPEQGPIVMAPPDPGSPVGNEDVPRSIRRLVAEQRDEVRSIRLLAADLRDRRGRDRAMQEAQNCAEELEAIESSIASAGLESESLDAVVVRLHQLETKTFLIHDALRQATL